MELTRRTFFTVALAPVVAAIVPKPALAFHRDAFALVAPGISMRMVRQYDIRTDQRVQRIDVLYGVATLRPELLG